MASSEGNNCNIGLCSFEPLYKGLPRMHDTGSRIECVLFQMEFLPFISFSDVSLPFFLLYMKPIFFDPSQLELQSKGTVQIIRKLSWYKFFSAEFWECQLISGFLPLSVMLSTVRQVTKGTNPTAGCLSQFSFSPQQMCMF